MQSLALAHDIVPQTPLEGKKDEILAILEKADAVPYISSREIKSNKGSTNCIYHHISKQQKDPSQKITEDSFNFSICFDLADCNQYVKEVGKMDAIKINPALVICFAIILLIGFFSR